MPQWQGNFHDLLLHIQQEREICSHRRNFTEREREKLQRPSYSRSKNPNSLKPMKANCQARRLRQRNQNSSIPHRDHALEKKEVIKTLGKRQRSRSERTPLTRVTIKRTAQNLGLEKRQENKRNLKKTRSNAAQRIR